MEKDSKKILLDEVKTVKDLNGKVASLEVRGNFITSIGVMIGLMGNHVSVIEEQIEAIEEKNRQMENLISLIGKR